MIYEFGNMWDIVDETDLFLITANGVIRQDGELVMGAGMALQVKNVYPDLPSVFGKAMINMYDNTYGYYKYGLMIMPHDPPIGAFQTKGYYRENTALDFIKDSTSVLFAYLTHQPNIRVDLNYPGIGLGGRTVEEVEPIISMLPDNVHVWRKDE